MKKLRIAVDLGGTTGRVGLYDGCPGSEIQIAYREFPISKGDSSSFVEDIGQLTATVEELVGEGTLAGIGIAVAGKLDAQRKTLIAAGNLTHWIGHPVVEILSEAFNCPVVLGNDAEAAALGEARARKEQDDFLYMIWGTGVGGAYVRYINGNPVPFAGEPGHVLVRAEGNRVCGCGRKCLESLVGGDAIGERYQKHPSELTKEEWAEVLGLMADGLHPLLTSQPVGMVVFGGGVANKQKGNLPLLEVLVAERLTMVNPPSITISELGEEGGLEGALALLSLAE